MKILQGLLILTILGLQVRLWTGPGSLAEIDRLEQAIADQESENATLDTRNQELITEVNALKTGTEAVEEMAREDLGLIREGETFYMIVDPKSRDDAAENNNKRDVETP